MKKILPIAIIAIVVVILGGCTNKNDDSKQPAVNGSVPVENNKGEEVSEGMMDKLAKIKNGESMKCTYTINMGEGDFQSESYVQGKKYKSISTMDADDQMKTYAIFDGETQYSWIDGQSEGFKMDMGCISGLEGASAAIEEENDDNPEDIMGMKEVLENAVGIDCQPVKDIDFSVPSEITFVDQCQLVKDQMNQLEELGGALPEGFEIPAEME